MPFCGSCGASVPGTTAFCADCGASLATSAKPKQNSSIEQVIFNENGVLISSSRFVCGPQTYPINGVTSIGTAVESPKRKGPVLAILLGGFVTLGVLLSGVLLQAFPAFLGGAAILGLGIWLFVSRKPTYVVLLRSASGETKAMANKNEDLVRRIVGALNEAVVLRG